ncbi:PAS domain-containing hybrid sensor histidine kinase/response regulator [Novosphingobium sp. KA1]|uniref:hybrid sensor histidine kinase/response regulator n=1 Tax=Novosphingobium sp. (strain KA1) TaxID=164608 RepID=UPI001A8FF0A8|nr:PAS domain-containing hybrid sensor histidine kinase/response regulator [Novosphingobium sp. KA1]QSR18554.1 hybrid sensor histidine kinase/response regulator [Novosphingobium sp. KA1]
MSLIACISIALALIVLLFTVAAFVERRGRALRRWPALRHGAYTLALGVYCTSWTFYGAVGSAVRGGWGYLPIYLGPLLLLLFAPRFLKRLAEAVAEERATTVSDFIAARFGHDSAVARLVTLIALLGSIPYLALQLRSIGSALSIVSGHDVMTPAMVAGAALLVLFAVLFGARRFELAGRSEGLLYAIGVDSVIKLGALLLVAGMAAWLVFSAPSEWMTRGLARFGAAFSPRGIDLEFAVILLISIFAVVALPRQFYMGLVEAQKSDDLVRARFGLAAYILVMALMALPIALAGLSLLPPATRPDLFVLQLPAVAGSQLVLAAALLGGIGAAASMAVVDSTALATMVSNDLFAGAVLRHPSAAAGAIGERMLVLRRLSIAGIMLLALAFALLIGREQSLASMGLVAFAAMAQFTPHLLLATTGRGRDPLAARASLVTGLTFWCYTLALPPILPPEWLAMLQGTVLDPMRLFGLGQASPLVHGVTWSLGANLLVHAAVAARKMPGPALPRLFAVQRRVSNLGELSQLVAGFVGEDRALREFPQTLHAAPVTQSAARQAQDLIAGVVGASSARALMASALASGHMALDDVTRLLDQGGRSLRFSRQLLASTFENIDAGISVVDAELNLIAWNARYEEFFDYPADLLRVGAPIEALIRHNAQRGDFGTEDIEMKIARRLDHLRAGSIHSFERRRNDGRVIKTVGGPMPGGGYVMSFTDMTEEARVRDELERTLEELEHRVEDRTRELTEANRLLARATQDKTRFLAAASHDLLQPLHAARLFTAALGRSAQEGEKPLVMRVDNAIIAAEELLRALLDISRLDAGGVTPSPEPVDLSAFLADMAESFRPMADAKGLNLKIGPLTGHVETDPGLLRSVMQNFLSNALRYTRHGGVLIGVRRRGDRLRIDVIDTGVGIPEAQRDAVFSEFTRLGTVDTEGHGLGLALVDRIVRLLGGQIEVASHEGRGSRFSLLLPAMASAPAPNPTFDVQHAASIIPAHRLSVLIVDNEPLIVEATSALVAHLGHAAFGASNIADAQAMAERIDVVLADYRLDRGEDGLTLIARLRSHRPDLPAAILTAETFPELRIKADALGVPVYAKPVDPARIEAFLAGITPGSVLEMKAQ